MTGEHSAAIRRTVELAPSRRIHWTAAQLMAAQFPEPRWAVPGLIAEGATLLAGPPKVGKSWLALGLAVAVASGGRALGKIEVDAGDVLYLALEDPPRRAQQRLGIVLAGDPAPDGLHLWTAIDDPVDELDAWCTAHPAARLVVVDVLAKVRPPTGEQTNQYQADYGAVGRLKAIADRHGVALVLVHHVRKAGADDFLDTISGTHGLAGAADTILILSRSRGAADAVLKVTGRDVTEAEHAVKFVADLGAWQLLDGPARDHELQPARRQILAAVREHDGLTPKKIAEVAGVSHDTVRQLVRKMVDAGDLDTDGAGRYFLPALSHRSQRSLTHTDE